MTRLAVALLTTLTFASLAAPLAAEAQPARLGILWPGSRTATGVAWRDVLLQVLSESGYVQGKNLMLEERHPPAAGRDEVLPELARDLVRNRVDVIITVSERATRAAREATTTIPIVFIGPADPVTSGHVTSFARPGGNATGVYPFTPELAGKILELLHEAAPRVSRVAVLWNPPSAFYDAEMKPAYERWRQTLALQLDFFEIRAAADIAPAIEKAVRAHAGALLVPSFPITFVERARIAELALQYRLPTAAGARVFAESGCLLAYGASWPDLFRRAATFVAKILGGAKPAELPVEQTAKYELVINLKTAKALGLTIPQAVLLRADEVIQ